ncbi:hydrolase [Thermococcus sp. MV5]|uniref:hydrolase n=1 Tax=Thermococcus sp. MV5 TaxID=1638272 RepID=UPI00143A3A4A|nr:hydrolase [Thermococcus sp. MV5]NJE25921.1 hydrolase [Thermococcus sp. MV5]
MRRRGFIFTLDALISLLLVMVFISSVVIVVDNVNIYPSSLREQEKYITQDALTMLRSSPLKDIVPPSILENWSSGSDPIIMPELVDIYMSPLDIVATYWAVDPLYPAIDLKHKAEIILGYILNVTLKDYNYELLVNNYTSPYLRRVTANYSKAFDVSPATLELSGYQYNQTPRGYVARAYITDIGSKENTYTARGGYIYARTDNSNDKVIIQYIIPADAIPADAVIDEIEWFFEPAWVGSQYEAYLNGQQILNRYITYNYRILDTAGDSSVRLIENFRPGENNVFEVRVYKSGYDGGEDGAQYIRIRYHTSAPLTLEYPKRFYFEDVSACYGITAWKYLFVPGVLTSLNVQVSVGNVTQNDPISLSFLFDTEISVPPTMCTYNSTTMIKTCYWDNSDIYNTLTSQGYSYIQISSRYTTIIVRAGNGNTRYNRIHLIGEDSFVAAEYTIPLLLTPYSVDVTEPITSYSASVCSDSWCREVTWSFNVPQGVVPLWVRFQFPWLYYAGTDPSQEIVVDNEFINATYFYKHPPNPFISALARLGYTKDTFDYQYNPLPNAIVNGKNNVTVNLGYGYWLQPSNGNGELTYIIRGYVGYGHVFPALLKSGCGGYNITYYWSGDSSPHHVTAGDPPYCNVTMDELINSSKNYAVDDAIVRLFRNLGGNGTQEGPIIIKLPDTVNIAFASMGNIPTLFEPITVTLRVWREE